MGASDGLQEVDQSLTLLDHPLDGFLADQGGGDVLVNQFQISSPAGDFWPNFRERQEYLRGDLLAIFPNVAILAVVLLARRGWDVNGYSAIYRPLLP